MRDGRARWKASNRLVLARRRVGRAGGVGSVLARLLVGLRSGGDGRAGDEGGGLLLGGGRRLWHRRTDARCLAVLVSAIMSSDTARIETRRMGTHPTSPLARCSASICSSRLAPANRFVMASLDAVCPSQTTFSRALDCADAMASASRLASSSVPVPKISGRCAARARMDADTSVPASKDERQNRSESLLRTVGTHLRVAGWLQIGWRR